MIDGRMADDATWKQCQVMLTLAEGMLAAQGSGGLRKGYWLFERRVLARPGCSAGLAVFGERARPALGARRFAPGGGGAEGGGVSAKPQLPHERRKTQSSRSADPPTSKNRAQRGKPLYRAAVANKACGTICWPNLPDALRVADVEADGQPRTCSSTSYTGGLRTVANVTEPVPLTTEPPNDYSSLLHILGRTRGYLRSSAWTPVRRMSSYLTTTAFGL